MISVVVPLYNKEMSIVSTIESVLAQTYKDWELIIVDDGSTDNSLNVVKEFVGQIDNRWLDDRLTIIHKENGGVCSARNRGIQEAKGEYVALLDGDDLWDKEYLAEQVMMIADFPDAAMWGINYAEVNNGKLVRSLPTALPDGYRGYVENYFEMPGRISDLYCSSSVLVRKDVFDKVGLFDERIRYAEDEDMWWRIIATHKVAFYDRYMVFYRFEAENRALTRPRRLRYDLPYYIGKYQDPIYTSNQAFWCWINRWGATHLRAAYFGANEQDREDSKKAVRDLDYSVIPFKYRLLYKWPYLIAEALNKLDKWYHNR